MIVVTIFFYAGLLSYSKAMCRRRIIGGVETRIEKYPFVVSLRFNNAHKCGATIITKNVVISASHCVQNKSEAYSVRVGSSSSVKGGYIIPVIHLIDHPKYDPYTNDCDISLLFLSLNLMYTRKIRPIPLYRQLNFPRKIVGEVIGWGSTNKSDEKEVWPYLKSAELPVFPNYVCKMMLPENTITDKVICAGNPPLTEDACAGDSGGPLVYEGKLLGIISWGFSCADIGFPGIYTYIPRMLDFIKNNANLTL